MLVRESCILFDRVTLRDARALVRWWNTHPIGWPPHVYAHVVTQSLTNPRLWAVERVGRIY